MFTSYSIPKIGSLPLSGRLLYYKETGDCLSFTKDGK